MISILLLSVLLGVAVGSFLNVVIYRIPANKRITGRSMCTSCGHILTPVELVPVISYVIQGRKCKSCSEPISSRYMTVELLTGVAFLLPTITMAASQSWNFPKLALVYIITASLISLAFIDFDTMEIPDRFHVIIIACALLISIISNGLSLKTIGGSLLGGLLISLPLFALAVITMGLGLGDVKLMFASGVLLGAYNSTIVLVVAGVSAITVAIISKIKKQEEFPFGPHLALAIYTVMLFVL